MFFVFFLGASTLGGDVPDRFTVSALLETAFTESIETYSRPLFGGEARALFRLGDNFALGAGARFNWFGNSDVGGGGELLLKYRVMHRNNSRLSVSFESFFGDYSANNLVNDSELGITASSYFHGGDLEIFWGIFAVYNYVFLRQILNDGPSVNDTLAAVGRFGVAAKISPHVDFVFHLDLGTPPVVVFANVQNQNGVYTWLPIARRHRFGVPMKRFD